MPHGYCTECQARVTAVGGHCLLGHQVDQSTISSRRGRRIAGTPQPAYSASVSVLERETTEIVVPTRPVSSPVTPAQGSPVTMRRPAPAKPQRQPGDRILDTGEITRVEPAAPRSKPPETRRTASAGIDLNPTGEMVLQLWDTGTGPDETLFDDWQVTEAMSGMPERSGPRIASAALIVVAVVAIVMSVSYVFSDRGTELEQLQSATSHLDAVLADFDVSTETSFSEIDQAARDVLATAQLLEVGDPSRAVAIDAASQILEGERTLSEALAYQTRFTVFMGRPALPTATDDVAAVSTTYIQWSTDLLGAVEPVPTDAAFEALTAEVADFTERAANIQARYLDALRAGDAEAATSALTTLDRRVSQLQTTVSDAVLAARDDFGVAITESQRLLGQLSEEA